MVKGRICRLAAGGGPPVLYLLSRSQRTRKAPRRDGELEDDPATAAAPPAKRSRGQAGRAKPAAAAAAAKPRKPAAAQAGKRACADAASTDEQPAVQEDGSTAAAVAVEPGELREAQRVRRAAAMAGERDQAMKRRKAMHEKAVRAAVDKEQKARVGVQCKQ